MNWKQNQRHVTNDTPPYSRIFVVCSKQQRLTELRNAFERFGKIEDIHMPTDRTTGESKGIAYIKYVKTSSAALAIQEMHLKNIDNSPKPVKVMVAVNRNDNINAREERYKRLFVKVHLSATESELYEHFSQFGEVDSVYLQRDKITDGLKGFAYVNFKTFLDAAKAFEGCDKKYKPIFATPKEELKRNRNSIEDNYQSSNSSVGRDNHNEYYGSPRDLMHPRDIFPPLLHNIKSEGYVTVCVTCSPPIPQKFLERLFNIIPGMSQCKYTSDNFNGLAKATITYENERSAAYAVESLNRFEFPSGEIIFVKPEENPLSKAANNLTSIVNSFKSAVENSDPNLAQLADAIAQASTLIKAATANKEQPLPECQDISCSVRLPPRQPLAHIDSKLAQRCFFVCRPHPPPTHILKDAFCRFGDLIDLCTFQDKNFGFVKYASVNSAQEAIKTLNRVTLNGVLLKVEEANERNAKIDDTSTDYNSDPKRKKLDEMMWNEEIDNQI